jgi:hypothetical protein
VNTRLRPIFRPALVAIVVALAAGCATNYRNDFDPSADFSKYHTYGTLGGREIEKTGLLENSLVRKRVETLIGRQLDARAAGPPGPESRSRGALLGRRVGEAGVSTVRPTLAPGWEGMAATRAGARGPYWSAAGIRAQ